jgi:hypothetical protein
VSNLPGDFPLNTKKHIESAMKFVEKNWEGPV